MRKVLAALAWAAACDLAHADQWRPWPNQRIVSKNGEFYVVAKRPEGKRFFNEWGPIEFTIARRRIGSLPVRPATADAVELRRFDVRHGGPLYEVLNDADVRVRAGDTVLARGLIDRPPRELHVLSSGNGFVALDVWGFNHAFSRSQQRALPAIRVFNAKGAVVHRLHLFEMFDDDELNLLRRTAGGTHWLAHSWLRDFNDELAIIAGRSMIGLTCALFDSSTWSPGKCVAATLATENKACD